MSYTEQFHSQRASTHNFLLQDDDLSSEEEFNRAVNRLDATATGQLMFPDAVKPENVLASTEVEPSSQIEVDALHELFMATNGPNWNTTWDLSGNICSQFGVGCSINGNVVTLMLLENGLEGTIPESLYNLTHLDTLTLFGDGLTGTISTRIGNLQSLLILNFVYNEITGTIPEELYDTGQLRRILLEGNQLTGTISQKIGNLESFFQLNVKDNFLSGTLPESIYDITSIAAITLIGNPFTGTISEKIGNLSLLVILFISDCSFSGTLPESIYDLPVLAGTSFVLRGNAFTGTISSRIGNLDQLTSLNFEGCNMSGTLPESIGALTLVMSITFADNSLSGQIPDSLWGLPLSFLDLSNNQFGGTLSPAVINMPLIIQLFSIDGNQISGTIPDELFQRLAILLLSIGSNKFSGAIPASIGDMISLGALNIIDNELVGPIPDELYSYSDSLARIQISHNNLTGTISTKIGQLQELQTLVLTNLSLSGAIPHELFDIEALVIISLQFNQLEGTIPLSIGQATLLSFLSLGNNHLSGHIPEEVQFLKGIAEMDLQSNALSGTIPESIASLTQLQNLDLSDNNLTGTITGMFFDPLRNNLERLNLNGNRISGTIPNGAASAFRAVTANALLEVTLAGIDFAGLTFGAIVSLNVSNNNLYGPRLPTNSASRSSIIRPVAFVIDPSVLREIPERFMQCADLTHDVLDNIKALVISIDPNYYDYEGCFCTGDRFWSEKGRGTGNPIIGQCLPCPSPHIDCGNEVVANPHHTMVPGFYAMSTTTGKQVLTGDELLDAAILPCFPQDICMTEGCANGHKGVACSQCEKGFYLRNFLCIKCPVFATSLIITFDVIVALIFLGYLWFTACSVEGNGKVMIASFYLQLLSVLKITGLYAPDNQSGGSGATQYVVDFFRLESVATFYPTALDCLFPYGFTNQFYVFIAFGPFLLIMFALLFGFQRLVVKCTRKVSEKYFQDSDPKKLILKLQWLYFYLLDFAYFPTVAACISVFNCVSTGGVSFLQAEPSVFCDSKSYYIMLGFAIIYTLFYGVGLYLYFGLSLHRAQVKFDSVEDEVKLSFLWNSLKPEKYWWRVTVVPLRKVAIALHLLFGHTSIVAPVIVFSVVLSTLIYQIRVDPYKENKEESVFVSDNILEIVSISVVLIVYQVAILQTFAGETLTDTNIWRFVSVIDLFMKAVFAALLIRNLYKSAKKRCSKKDYVPPPSVKVMEMPSAQSSLESFNPEDYFLLPAPGKTISDHGL